ncbi:hypothetical protein AAVH_14125 [Aphelenchoides avenae]|nr:hypothetical protein AAVH_14125 [Aphelenchus avenae]
MRFVLVLCLLVVLIAVNEAAPATDGVAEAFFPVGNYHISANKPGEAIKRSDWISECFKGLCVGHHQCKTRCLSCEGDLARAAKGGHCSDAGACWCTDH